MSLSWTIKKNGEIIDASDPARITDPSNTPAAATAAAISEPKPTADDVVNLLAKAIERARSNKINT